MDSKQHTEHSENRKTFRQYLMQSLTGAGSLILAISFFFALYNLGRFFTGIGKLINILMPLLYGLAIAFILGPMSEWWEEVFGKLLTSVRNDQTREMLARGLGVALSVITALAIVTIVLVLVLPQLFSSIVNLVNSVPAASARLTAWVQKILADSPDIQSQVLTTFNDASNMVLDWVQNTLLPRFQGLMNSLSSGVMGFMAVLKNLILGIIISVYLMFSRRQFISQSKKLLYSIVPLHQANRFLFLLREVKTVFSGFLIGKLLDSLIIGMICFICMTLLDFPYTILISTIVGVTNIIPYFGPFIGAIPSAILVLTVNPWQALYFLIFILILQQVDGNIIGPRILGNATGLPSFWVLISLLLFGGLFGVFGMVIGVPVFAVLYDLADRAIGILLERRHLPPSSASYELLDHIDPVTHQLVMQDPAKELEEKQRKLELRLENQQLKRQRRKELLERLRRKAESIRIRR